MLPITIQALKYLEWGLSVVPVGAIVVDDLGTKKVNFPVHWTPYQSKKATAEQIEEWFEVRKYPNIGCVTGKISNLFVLKSS